MSLPKANKLSLHFMLQKHPTDFNFNPQLRERNSIRNLIYSSTSKRLGLSAFELIVKSNDLRSYFALLEQ